MNELLIDKIIENLNLRFPENIQAIYGIGSFFDDTLPTTWKKNDMDLIIIVNDMKKIPKEEWDFRYSTKRIEGQDVFYAFYTIESFQDKNLFGKIYGSNYEWALLEMKHPENSVHLYGEDIRNFLPDTNNLEFDYDDILARVVYHLDKALDFISKEKMPSKAYTEFTKSIFKFCFYLCIYHDNKFRSKRLFDIRDKILELEENNLEHDYGYQFLKQAIFFRIENKSVPYFSKLLFKYVEYLFNSIGAGRLHRTMKYPELKKFLMNTFNGFPHLLKILKQAKEKNIS